ncbi:MAG: acyl-CoA dehydrogenase family protein [Acidobacteriota bacterium]
MDFSWTAEQDRAREKIVQFARQELSGQVIELDERGEFNRQGWEKCVGLGIQGLPIPTRYGGGEAEALTTLYLLEGLGYGCKDAGLVFAINAQMWGCELPILSFGSESQKTRYLPDLCAGRSIGALAASEREAGSDTNNIQTLAERKSDYYLLNGSKTFVTNAPVADVLLVVATLDRDRPKEGITAFLVEKDFPGFPVERTLDKMGLRTAPMGAVRLTDCRVPVENRLGREGAGGTVFRHAMEWERAFILAAAVGTMERQLEECCQYARTRRQFGQPIGKFQLLASKLVDQKIRLETARLLLYKVGWLKQRGRSIFMEASLAKLYVSECWVQSSMDAVQIHGGYGYLTENEVERGLRDAIGSRLYSGTSEIQRLIIARFLGL